MVPQPLSTLMVVCVGMSGWVSNSHAFYLPVTTMGLTPLSTEFCGSQGFYRQYGCLSRSSNGPTMRLGFKGKKTPKLTDTPPMKVALLVEPTPFTHISGYANRFREMLKFMAKSGDDVQILTTDDKEDAPTSHLKFPISTTAGFRFPLYDHIVLTFDWEMKGWKLLDKMKPDLIHVTSPGFLCMAALMYARIFRIPILFSYHTHLPLYGRSYLGWLPFVEDASWGLLRYFHNRADLTLCTSPQMQAELTEQGVERVDVWRKGIDVERFNPEFKSAEMRHRLTDGHPEDPLIIYVGRLGSEKRLRDIRGVLERIPNARLALVGGGPDEEALKEFFAGTKVVFTGPMSGKPLSEAFASADVFVMPSDSETLGFVVLESMASGVPVVGADAGGIPDLIDDGKTGFLVKPGDAEAFSVRVRQLLENEGMRGRMALAARQETERWSWEAATSYLRNVQYKKAIANFKTRALGGLGLPHTKTRLRAMSMRAKLASGQITTKARLASVRVINLFRWPVSRKNKGLSGDEDAASPPVAQSLEL
ncbi:unnamed protein product [Discosporangium mesarthrocarpum]